MWRINKPDAIAILDNEAAKKSLQRYFAVLQNVNPAKFMIAKKLATKLSVSDSLDDLWAEHANRTLKFRDFESKID